MKLNLITKKIYSIRRVEKIDSIYFHLRIKLGRSFITEEMRSKGVIFTHIPKAAGRTMQKQLGFTDQVGHFPLRFIKNEDPKFYENSLRITVVRNSVSRFLSAFNYLTKKPLNQFDEYVGKYLAREFDGPIDLVKNCHARHWIWGIPHFRTQKYFLGDSWVGDYDMIIALERMSEALPILADKLSVPILNNRENVTPSYGQWLSEGDRFLILQRYEEDNVIYDYASRLRNFDK